MWAKQAAQQVLVTANVHTDIGAVTCAFILCIVSQHTEIQTHKDKKSMET